MCTEKHGELQGQDAEGHIHQQRRHGYGRLYFRRLRQIAGRRAAETKLTDEQFANSQRHIELEFEQCGP